MVEKEKKTNARENRHPCPSLKHNHRIRNTEKQPSARSSCCVRKPPRSWRRSRRGKRPRGGASSRSAAGRPRTSTTLTKVLADLHFYRAHVLPFSPYIVSTYTLSRKISRAKFRSRGSELWISGFRSWYELSFEWVFLVWIGLILHELLGEKDYLKTFYVAREGGISKSNNCFSILDIWVEFQPQFFFVEDGICWFVYSEINYFFFKWNLFLCANDIVKLKNQFLLDNSFKVTILCN